jgi:uncharacterized phage protein (TIGR01671 family)
MREIKFRAWDNKEKRMIFGGIVNFCSPLHTIEMPLGELHKHALAVHPSRDYNLMQFTGLHDKNGKEIYEGDVVSAPTKTNRYEIEFSHDRFQPANWDRYGINGEDNFNWCDFEVIGNIYENPELLKV